ncbi:MAG: hypothetical protein QM796_18730 [Chthoniobacteraceae bacterium]
MAALTLILLFAIFATIGIAWRVITSLPLLREFGVPTQLAILQVATLGLMVVPIFAVLARGRFPQWFWFPAPVGLLFFVPHVLLTRGLIRQLQKAGTSRVKTVLGSLLDSLWLAGAGGAYVGLIWLLGLFGRQTLAAYSG